MHGSRGQLYVRTELVQNWYPLAEMIWRTYVAAVVESVAPKPARFKYQREVASETSKIFVWGRGRAGCPAPQN
jgi:hypothetical protein